MSASSLILEELSGRRRKLTLVGPGLPLRGAAWSGEQRLVTEFYPGNTEATQQVLGPVEIPSDWEGVWNSTRLVSAPQSLSEAGAEVQIVRAFPLYETFEDFVRSGSLLRVTWTADQGRKILREGRVGPYSFKVDRADDIRWSAQFVWVGRGGSVTKVAPRDESVEAAMRATLQALTDLQSALAGAAVRTLLPDVPTSLPRFGLDDLQAIADTPSALLSGLTNSVSTLTGKVSRTVAILEQFKELPNQLRSQAALAASDTRITAKSVTTRISRLPSESWAASGVSVGRSLRLMQLGIKARRTATVVESRALAVESSARHAQTNNPAGRRANNADSEDALAVHLVTQGQTFASIALKYYGDAGLGGTIAKANGYPRHAVTPRLGARLLIPAKS